MASSQVEIAASAPFGCVLRDHGPGNGGRETNTRVAHAALQNVVRDHLKNCLTTYDQINPANLRLQNEDRNPRKSEVLDRWPTRQVHKEEQQQEATDSPDSSDSSLVSSSETCAADISTLAASSLVQIWEQRLTPSNSNKISSCSSPTSRSSSGLGNHETTFCAQEEKRESKADETDKTGQAQPHQQFDHEVSSQQSKPALRNSNAGERLRVMDIIKRLSGASEDSDLEQSCSDKNCYSVSEHHAEHRKMVISSPRLRGRQAFNDLLMLMEGDRYGELHALAERATVSKFTQRGRIQSLLRLRLLQREVAAYDPPYLQQARVAEVRRQPRGSISISHLRKRFNNIGDEKETKVQSEADHKRSSPRKTVTNTTQSSHSVKKDSDFEDNLCQDFVDNAEGRAHIVQDSVSCTRGVNAKVENTSISGSINIVEAQKAQEMVEPTESMEGCNVYAINPDLKASNIVVSTEAKTVGSQKISEATPSMGDQKVESGPELDAGVGISFEVRVNSQEIAKATLSMDGCDDIHGMEQESEASSPYYDHEMTEEIYESYPYDQYEISYDWIAHISRPRSYWENLRQEWYKEMLSCASDKKEEIRQLIERRTVSTFLSSDFRETMNKLMACQLGRKSNLKENEEDDENSEFELMAFLREHSYPAGCHQGGHEIENETEKEQEQQEDVSLTSSQYHHQVNDDFVQSPSSTEISSPSWICIDNDTAMDDSVRFASPSSLYDDSRQNSSCNNNNSVVMELICDLRGQMQQLHQEMADLRKSIKGCIDMKISTKQETHSSAAGQGRKSCDGLSMKGNCWVCREVKANTVLYKCGHMCACLKCANELKWSNGKCPICRAVIVDVVRVYVDTQGENW